MITESRDRWLAQLYEENYRRIYCLAVYRLRQGSGRIEEAEDVVQEVFCRAIKHEVWQHENPAGWLIVATNNVCSEMYKEYIRQGKRQEKLERRIKDAKPAEVRTLFDGAIPSETEVSDIMIFDRADGYLADNHVRFLSEEFGGESQTSWIHCQM